MGVLIDTSVLVELLKPEPNANVVQWTRSQPDTTLRLSSITVAEMLASARLNLDASVGRRVRSMLSQRIFSLFGPCELPFDERAAQLFGDVLFEAHRAGNLIDSTHAMVGAIARANNLQLATKHDSAFAGVKIALVNPWNTSA